MTRSIYKLKDKLQIHSQIQNYKGQIRPIITSQFSKIKT